MTIERPDGRLIPRRARAGQGAHPSTSVPTTLHRSELHAASGLKPVFIATHAKLRNSNQVREVLSSHFHDMATNLTTGYACEYDILPMLSSIPDITMKIDAGDATGRSALRKG
jgi:hypothetical protein